MKKAPLFFCLLLGISSITYGQTAQPQATAMHQPASISRQELLAQIETLNTLHRQNEAKQSQVLIGKVHDAMTAEMGKTIEKYKTAIDSKNKADQEVYGKALATQRKLCYSVSLHKETPVANISELTALLTSFSQTIN